jgi:hypothetical protein
MSRLSWTFRRDLALSPGVKANVVEAVNFFPPNAEFKNKWNYKSTSPIDLHGLKRNSFTFIYQKMFHSTKNIKYLLMQLLRRTFSSSLMLVTNEGLE